MNILGMHILLDQLINKINANVWDSVLDEEKDNLLNIHIREFVDTYSNDPPSGARDDYDIIAGYNGLSNIIRTYAYTAPLSYTGGGFSYARFADLGILNSLTAGSTFLSESSAASPFTAGERYTIWKIYSGDDFTLYGATANTEGTTFTGVVSPSPLQPVSHNAGVVLLSGSGTYTTSNEITSPGLDAGVLYTVLDGGSSAVTFTGAAVVSPNTIKVWNSTYSGVDVEYGVNLAGNLVLGVGDKFMINDVDTGGLWTNGSILEELNSSDAFYKYLSSSSKVAYDCGNGLEYDIVPNRLVKRVDVEAFMKHSFGTALSEPLCFLQDNKLVVVHSQGNSKVPSNRQFDVSEIYLTYYKKPAEVSLSANTNCDLDEPVHEKIVRNTAETILAAINGGTWQKLREDNMKSNIKTQ